jgi:hypothetical protein
MRQPLSRTQYGRQMARIPVGQWAPDSAGVDATVLFEATNVFPTATGYGPVRGLNPVSTALPAEAKGGIGVQRSDLTWDFYAGTATKLYKFNPGTSGWTDVSNPSTTYSVAANAFWSFFTDGPKLYATHSAAPLQVIDIDTGTQFANVGGSPPFASTGAAVSEFIVLAGLADDPFAVQWSSIGNPNEWIPGLNLGDIQHFPMGGPVTAFSGGEFGVIFQEQAIRSMVFAPGSAEVFQISKAEEGRGAVSPTAVAQLGAQVFFVDRTGIFRFTGGVSQSIGTERINRWFNDNINTSTLKKIQVVPDTRGPRILFGLQTATGGSDATLLDKILVYDYTLDKWSLLDVDVRVLFSTSLPGVALDSITTSLDDPSLPSLDSAAFAGGEAALAALGPENKLNFFEGAVLEATLTTADMLAARPNQSFVRGIRVDTDASQVYASFAVRQALSESLIWRQETLPNRRRFNPARARGRYHRAKIRIPSATTWTYLSGLEVNPVVMGE